MPRPFARPLDSATIPSDACTALQPQRSVLGHALRSGALFGACLALLACGSRSVSGHRESLWQDEAGAASSEEEPPRANNDDDSGAGPAPETDEPPAHTDDNPPDPPDVEPEPTSTPTAIPVPSTTAPATSEPPVTNTGSGGAPPVTDPSGAGGGSVDPTGSGGSSSEGGAGAEGPSFGGSGAVGVGGFGSGGYGAGGSGGYGAGGSTEPGTCSATSHNEYEDSCDISYNACRSYTSASCYMNGDSWRCSCNSNNNSYYDFVVNGEDDPRSNCEVAASACVEPLALSESICEQSGLNSEDSYCSSYTTCSQTATLGNGVSLSLQVSNELSCSQDGDSWYCYCSYPSFQNYSSYNLDGVSGSDACVAVTQLCEGSPQVPVGETLECGEYSPYSDDRYCSTSRTCQQALPLEGGGTASVQVSESTTCELTSEGWRCTCAGELMRPMELLEPESTDVDVACSTAAALCDAGRNVEPMGDLDCDVASMNVNRDSSCNASLKCAKPVTTDQGTIDALEYVYLNCYPGVEGWACDCGDNDESILISATLGDDVWDSCNTAAEQCVSTLDLSFGAN